MVELKAKQSQVANDRNWGWSSREFASSPVNIQDVPGKEKGYEPQEKCDDREHCPASFQASGFC